MNIFNVIYTVLVVTVSTAFFVAGCIMRIPPKSQDDPNAHVKNEAGLGAWILSLSIPLTVILVNVLIK